jgi:hypothetical protein
MPNAGRSDVDLGCRTSRTGAATDRIAAALGHEEVCPRSVERKQEERTANTGSAVTIRKLVIIAIQ